jgi:tetratricopeptide (TPR) repeat protein
VSCRRGAGLIVFLAIAAYANTLGNGFAYDDNEIVLRNRIVTEGDVLEAVSSPYWPAFAPGTGLYRPVTVASYALEWPAFRGHPMGFHVTNVLAHGLVTLLVFGLLVTVLPRGPSLLGAGLFAIHPVHTEAVANVVGRAELYAAAFFLAACLVYVRGRDWEGWKRLGRVPALGALYFLALGSKEISVTLPAAILLLEILRRHPRPLRARLFDELPGFLALAAALSAYLLVRYAILGSILGEAPAPVFRDLDAHQRVLTALSLWPEYLRLMAFPVDLVADYAPGVLFPSTSLTPEVLAGSGILLGLLLLASILWTRAGAASLGIAWFLVTVLPVSQLFFPTGTLLAERTLYLPSVGLALIAGELAARVWRRTPAWKWSLVAVSFVMAAALLVRTVTRNPSWLSTYAMLEVLAREHPESYLAHRTRGTGLIRVGEVEEGLRAYETALALAPRNYGLLAEVAAFHGTREQWGSGEQLLRRAVAAAPRRHAAYRHLASQLILQGRAREGHAVALEGLRRGGSDRELWALVSESYIAKGDLQAAARARQAALGQDPKSAEDWIRLAEILAAQGDSGGAAKARVRAEELEVPSSAPRT